MIFSLLPLLQFCAQKNHMEIKDSDKIIRKHYLKNRRCFGALSTHADDVYNCFTETKKNLVKR